LAIARCGTIAHNFYQYMLAAGSQLFLTLYRLLSARFLSRAKRNG